MKKILFVCTGNTCRSPMAEALFRKHLMERPEMSSAVEVSSAGIYAFNGDPASMPAIDVMSDEFGINIKSHRSKLLMDEDIRQAYLILTMTRHHREMILDVYPEAADKVYTLKAFAELDDVSPDIIDPYGGDYQTYQECAYEIESILMDVIDKLFDNED